MIKGKLIRIRLDKPDGTWLIRTIAQEDRLLKSGEFCCVLDNQLAQAPYVPVLSSQGKGFVLINHIQSLEHPSYRE